METPSASRRAIPTVRTGQGSTKVSRSEFERRYQEQFYDPAFDGAKNEIMHLTNVAWESYQRGVRSPRKRRAGPEFADPEQELPAEWLNARAAMQEAQRRHERSDGPSRVLLICGSPRTDETCPSEMSKTFRIAESVRGRMQGSGCEVDFLDLSRMTSEYGRVIHPCKGCVSTAMPLCHWPCSCYPNHYLGQIHDWMNELYPRWIAAHGVMIVSPVHWFHAPSVLKLMMDRLVCADGGNPDPTTTAGKDAVKAKALEMQGWPYPRHLAGRVFSVIVHGDVEGASELRRALHDWMTAMELVPAGAEAMLDRYVGYFEEYAASHEALDRDAAFMQEASNAAAVLMMSVAEMRAGRKAPGQDIRSPRQK
jgi:multimeric flavodoxin WrbA